MAILDSSQLQPQADRIAQMIRAATQQPQPDFQDIGQGMYSASEAAARATINPNNYTSPLDAYTKAVDTGKQRNQALAQGQVKGENDIYNMMASQASAGNDAAKSILETAKLLGGEENVAPIIQGLHEHPQEVTPQNAPLLISNVMQEKGLKYNSTKNQSTLGYGQVRIDANGHVIAQGLPDPAKMDPFTKAELEGGAKEAIQLPDMAASANDIINRANNVIGLSKKTSTGPFVGSESPILGVLPSMDRMHQSVSQDYSNLKQNLSGLQLDAAKLLSGQGAVSDNERRLLGNFSGGTNLEPETIQQAAQAVIKVQQRTKDMAADWTNARQSGVTNFIQWKNQWMNNRLKQEGQNTGGQVTQDAPPSGAVQFLQQHPETAAQFEQKYGVKAQSFLGQSGSNDFEIHPGGLLR